MFLRGARLDQRVLTLIQKLLDGCSTDQTIPCEAIEEDAVLATPKALLAVSVIPCDEKKRRETVALQEVRLKRIQIWFDSGNKRMKEAFTKFKHLGLTVCKVPCYLVLGQGEGKSERISSGQVCTRPFWLKFKCFILFLFAAKPKFLIELNQRFSWI